MADFQEVMRQAARMCRAHEECEECPVCMIADMVPSGCLFGGGIDAGYIEEKIMGWAEENPEPRYPSWEEWQKANFPNAPHSICPNYFMRKKPLGTCAVSCAKCTGTPIPADIAEKLGIRPIGGEENEKT